MHRFTLTALPLALCAMLALSSIPLAKEGTEREKAAPAPPQPSNATSVKSGKSNAQDRSTATSGDPYYLATSPTGKSLGDKPLVEDYAGRELRFADKADAAAFHADEAKYIAELDEQLIADQLPYYALTTCPITGEPLEAPVNYVYHNRLVRFCCSGCILEFETDLAKYLVEVDEAAKVAQRADYPLEKCIVLPDNDYVEEQDILVGGRLFRLCCGGCAAEVRANPAEWIAQLDEARK